MTVTVQTENGSSTQPKKQSRRDNHINTHCFRTEDTFSFESMEEKGRVVGSTSAIAEDEQLKEMRMSVLGALDSLEVDRGLQKDTNDLPVACKEATPADARPLANDRDKGENDTLKSEEKDGVSSLIPMSVPSEVMDTERLILNKGKVEQAEVVKLLTGEEALTSDSKSKTESTSAKPAQSSLTVATGVPATTIAAGSVPETLLRRDQHQTLATRTGLPGAFAVNPIGVPTVEYHDHEEDNDVEVDVDSTADSMISTPDRADPTVPQARLVQPDHFDEEMQQAQQVDLTQVEKQRNRRKNPKCVLAVAFVAILVLTVVLVVGLKVRPDNSPRPNGGQQQPALASTLGSTKFIRRLCPFAPSRFYRRLNLVDAEGEHPSTSSI